jgi:ABC-2 type transport system ATP-binding protein
VRRTALAAAALTLVATAVPAAALTRSAAVVAEPVVTSQVVRSFDGTDLFTTLFLPAGASAAKPVPLVLRTHGWGGTGETSKGGTLGKLVDAGYAVLTWDSRGFGQSGGEVHIDNPLFEGKDASALIDWAVANAPIAKDRTGDPVVGMSGGSYAGGIQTATASFDQRIDAIAPEISWRDLRYALAPGDVIKLGWVSLLYAAGNTALSGGIAGATGPAGLELGRYTPDLDRALATGAATGQLDNDAKAFLAGSSIDHYASRSPLLDVPTLVMQGSVDTLFNLTDGYGIYEQARRAGAPAKFIAFCGGHVGCPADYAETDDRAHLDKALLTWFDRYLRGSRASTGAPVEYRTNAGGFRPADGFAPSNRTVVTGVATGSLVSTAAPETASLSAPGLGTVTTAVPSAAGDPRAITAEVLTAARDTDLVGIPTATVEVSGTGDSAHLFLKLVHRETGHVLNLQEAPVRVAGLTTPQTLSVRMPGIAYTLPAGDHLDLQVSTASSAYLNARVPALVDVTATVQVPTVPAGGAAVGR